MIPIRIDDPQDPHIADYHSVPDPELVRERGLFVAEGRFVVERLLADRRWAMRSVLLSDAAYRELEPALSASRRDLPVYLCRTEDFLSITGFDIHRGCLAIGERPPDRDVQVLAAGGTLRTVIALEDVANADNVGGVFRNAAAFGVDAVIVSPGCCDPLYRKAIRTSMAATFRVPFARATRWPADVLDLKDHGFAIAALTPREPAETLSVFSDRPRPERLVLVVGSEGEGVSAPIERAADYRVRIPILAEVDSLNLAVATGIALYELALRR